MILGINGIEESSVYQDIFGKGEATGRDKGLIEGSVTAVRAALLRQGRKKFGPPSETVEATINALTDLDRLNALLDRILDVPTWDDLLAPPDAGITRGA